MSLVTDSTNQLRTHIDELESLGAITSEEAERLRARVSALEGDLQDAYDE